MQRLATTLAPVLVVVTACYSPDLAPCSVHCAPNTTCPDDMQCGSDHMCHPPGDTTVCKMTLDIQIEGGGAGTVTSDPAGINCNSNSTGPGCDLMLPLGTPVTLTESHTVGNTFTSWTGDVCDGSTATTCMFTIEMPTTVTATFD
jgi:hypothetical protein